MIIEIKRQICLIIVVQIQVFVECYFLNYKCLMVTCFNLGKREYDEDEQVVVFRQYKFVLVVCMGFFKSYLYFCQRGYVILEVVFIVCLVISFSRKVFFFSFFSLIYQDRNLVIVLEIEVQVGFLQRNFKFFLILVYFGYLLSYV